jgi:hypothetical protein
LIDDKLTADIPDQKTSLAKVQRLLIKTAKK